MNSGPMSATRGATSMLPGASSPSRQKGVDTVASCMAQQRPACSTPEHIRRFRHDAVHPLGQPGRHPGLAGDGPRRTDIRYGAPNRFDGSVGACLSPHKVGLVAERPLQQELREPLGRTPLRSGVELPEATRKPGFAFGICANRSENAKGVMYPASAGGDAEAGDKWSCGRQKDRGYDWAARGIDPTKNRFGKPSGSRVVAGAGAGGAGSAPFAPDAVQCGAALVPSPTKAHRAAHNGEVGSPRRTGCAPVLAPDHAYGAPLRKDAVSVRGLLTGVGAPREQPAAEDLGKPMVSSNPHVRHAREADRRALAEKCRVSSGGEGGAQADAARCIEAHAFGAPTVRRDQRPPAHPKITSNVNYGDEPSAAELLHPSALSQRVGGGGGDALTLDEAWRLCERCAFGLTREQVELCFKLAQRQQQQQQQRASPSASTTTATVSAKALVAAIDQAGF